MPSLSFSADELELILYCLEQQSGEMNATEDAMTDRIIDEITSAQVLNH